MCTLYFYTSHVYILKYIIKDKRFFLFIVKKKTRSKFEIVSLLKLYGCFRYKWIWEIKKKIPDDLSVRSFIKFNLNVIVPHTSYIHLSQLTSKWYAK